MKCSECGARITLTAMETRAKPGATDAVDGHALLGRVLGGYRLDAVIGGGGMGIVFEARRTAKAEIDGPEVAAVKVLSSAFARDPDFVRRFEREADALLALRHDNLIRVFGKGEDEGLYFFIMERFDGEDLRSLIRRGPIDRTVAAQIVAAAAAGLAHAHEQGVVHRDVKPANILVRCDDERCVVKVVDFGVAQLAAPDYTLTALTHSNLILGTVNYMSPEQRTDAANIDRRADIYALGVVAYELLTGRLPIGAFEPPSGLTRSLPGAVDKAVLSALRRDPAQRPASVLAFAAALEKALRPSRTWAVVSAGLAAAAIAGVVVVADPFAPKPVEKTTAAEQVSVAKEAEQANTAEAPEATEEAWSPPPQLEQVVARIREDVAFIEKQSDPPALTTKKPKAKKRRSKAPKEITSKKNASKKAPSKKALSKELKGLALD
ncbi:MAG: protein kinase [Deltaproteobacteria bacterium]